MPTAWSFDGWSTWMVPERRSRTRRPTIWTENIIASPHEFITPSQDRPVVGDGVFDALRCELRGQTQRMTICVTGNTQRTAEQGQSVTLPVDKEERLQAVLLVFCYWLHGNQNSKQKISPSYLFLQMRLCRTDDRAQKGGSKRQRWVRSSDSIRALCVPLRETKDPAR